jgi:hypothetical protein
MEKDVLLHLLAAHFGIQSRLEPGYPHCVILTRGDNEAGFPLNAPRYDVFAPLVIFRIIERFDDVTRERLFTVYNEFLAARR